MAINPFITHLNPKFLSYHSLALSIRDIGGSNTSPWNIARFYRKMDTSGWFEFEGLGKLLGTWYVVLGVAMIIIPKSRFTMSAKFSLHLLVIS